MSDSFPYEQLPISTVPDLSDQIERTTELIGRGGYGSVYKGRWLGAAANATPAIIAIKIIELPPLREEVRRARRFKQITRELSLWCSIQHENILPLWGIARINGDTNVPAFVCPWLENGNAKEFCSRNPRFPPVLLLYDIINGLHYLHTRRPEIVHGDIKAVNVLINNRCEACLCDFGLSRFITDHTLWKTTATHAGGTVRWMAPELINGDASTPTKESDIYAYAMTCYEILSGDIPFKSVSNDMAIPIKIMKGQRPNRIESFHPDFMWDIIIRCWEQDPDDRLTAEKVSLLLLPKVDWKETLATIGEKDVVLAKVEKEMVVLKEQMAETLAKAEDLKILKDKKEQALASAEEDLKVSREENDAALASAEEEMRVLRKDRAAAERRKNDVEEKYKEKIEELKELKAQFEETMAVHRAEAEELRRATECAREGSSLLAEELTSLQHKNSSLHKEVERLKHEAQAREEEAVAVQQNAIAILNEEVARGLIEGEKTSGNLEKAEVYHNQTRRGLKQRIKETLAKFGEKDVGLAKPVTQYVEVPAASFFKLVSPGHNVHATTAVLLTVLQRAGESKAAIAPVAAEIYSRCMAVHGQGYPLYNPEPDPSLSPDNRKTCIRIGDVGLITRDGSFDFLFNVCSQYQHVNPPQLPDNFKTIDYVDVARVTHSPRGRHFFNGVEQTTGLSSYRCTGKAGAILELPEGATLFEAQNRNAYRDLAARHAESWYKYTMVTRKRSASNGSLYLVTGSVKTDVWGVAVFDGPSNSEDYLRFIVDEAPIRNLPQSRYKWEQSGSVVSSVGPRKPSSNKEVINVFFCVASKSCFGKIGGTCLPNLHLRVPQHLIYHRRRVD